jgi:Rubredoxin-like zinc ribbon domain (DUF35_N)
MAEVSLLSRFPDPIPDFDSMPFWDSAQRGRLRIQVCPHCSRGVFPPKPSVCPICRVKLEWTEVASKGGVYSWIGIDHPVHDWLKGVVPFTVVVLELDELPDVRIPCFYDGLRGALALKIPGFLRFADVGRKYPMPVFETIAGASREAS